MKTSKRDPVPETVWSVCGDKKVHAFKKGVPMCGAPVREGSVKLSWTTSKGAVVAGEGVTFKKRFGKPLDEARCKDCYVAIADFWINRGKQRGKGSG